MQACRTHQGRTLSLTSMVCVVHELCSCICVTSWSDTYWRGALVEGQTLHFASPLEKQPVGLTKGGPWVLRALWRNDQ